MLIYRLYNSDANNLIEYPETPFGPFHSNWTLKFMESLKVSHVEFSVKVTGNDRKMFYAPWWGLKKEGSDGIKKPLERIKGISC